MQRPQAYACMQKIFRETLCRFAGSYVRVRVCMSGVCVRKGKRMTEVQVERRLLSLTQHLSHFITKSSMTNSSSVWQRWGRQGRKKKKRSSGDKSRGGHLDAANIASVMQHVCVTSNVTFTWCSHPCVILRYGGVTVMVLISYRLSPSQHKRLVMEKCYHLSDYKKKMSGDNTINRACKIWINGSL